MLLSKLLWKFLIVQAAYLTSFSLLVQLSLLVSKHSPPNATQDRKANLHSPTMAKNCILCSFGRSSSILCKCFYGDTLREHFVLAPHVVIQSWLRTYLNSTPKLGVRKGKVKAPEHFAEILSISIIVSEKKYFS